MKKIVLNFSRELYSKEALIKASYHFIDRCYIHIDCNVSSYIVELTAKATAACPNAGEFENELLAQTARQIVYKQTHVIREVLLARAMASTIAGEVPQEPDTAESAGDDALEDILTDWFEKNEK